MEFRRLSALIPAEFGIRLARGRMLRPAPLTVRRTGYDLAASGGLSRRSGRDIGEDMAVQDSKRRVALITGVTGQDGAYLAGISARPRLHRAWHQAALVLVQHRAHRSSLRGSARRQRAVPAALRRHDGFDQSDPADAADQADRDLQSRGPKPCRGQLREPGIYRQCRCDRRAAAAGGDPHSRHGEGDAVLSGLHLRTVRPGAGSAAEGNHAVLSALALWRRQALRLLDHGELPRGLRHVRLQRHPVQS